MGSFYRAVSVILITAGLTACGGGGGGGDDDRPQQTEVTPSAVIDPTTAPDIVAGISAASAFTSIVGAQFLALVDELYFFTPLGAEPAARRAPADTLAEAIPAVVDYYLNVSRNVDVAPLVAFDDERADCDSGSISISGEIETLDNPTVGDNLDLRFFVGFTLRGFLCGFTPIEVTARHAPQSVKVPRCATLECQHTKLARWQPSIHMSAHSGGSTLPHNMTGLCPMFSIWLRHGGELVILNFKFEIAQLQRVSPAPPSRRSQVDSCLAKVLGWWLFHYSGPSQFPRSCLEVTLPRSLDWRC